MRKPTSISINFMAWFNTLFLIFLIATDRITIWIALAIWFSGWQLTAKFNPKS